jgi:organic radical activating enzyme
LNRKDKRDIEALEKEQREYMAEQDEIKHVMEELIRKRPPLNEKVKTDQDYLKEVDAKLESSKEQEQEPEEK